MAALTSKILTVQIDQTGRKKFAAQNEKVVIVRSFNPPGRYSVVCAAFSPFGRDNTVEFFSYWNVYASTQAIKNFNIINPDVGISRDAEKGYTYSFSDISFGNGTENGLEWFGIENLGDTTLPLTVGLTQGISVQARSNVNSPISVESVEINETIFFDPLDRIKVFVANNMATGTILPTAILKNSAMSTPTSQKTSSTSRLTIGRYLQIELTEQTTIIHFNRDSNLFEPGPLQ